MTIRSAAFAALSAIALSACAQKSEDISAAYVSPLNFQSHSCAQLSQEAQRISQRATSAMAKQDAQASADAATTAVSLILFWPAALLIAGDDENAQEVSRLKGEMEAIERVNISKNCGLPLGKA